MSCSSCRSGAGPFGYEIVAKTRRRRGPPRSFPTTRRSRRPPVSGAVRSVAEAVSSRTASMKFDFPEPFGPIRTLRELNRQGRAVRPERKGGGAGVLFAKDASMPFPNGLAFDTEGALFTTDSATGSGFRIDSSGRAERWASADLDGEEVHVRGRSWARLRHRRERHRRRARRGLRGQYGQGNARGPTRRQGRGRARQP